MHSMYLMCSVCARYVRCIIRWIQFDTFAGKINMCVCLLVEGAAFYFRLPATHSLALLVIDWRSKALHKSSRWITPMLIVLMVIALVAAVIISGNCFSNYRLGSYRLGSCSITFVPKDSCSYRAHSWSWVTKTNGKQSKFSFDFGVITHSVGDVEDAFKWFTLPKGLCQWSC